MVTEFPIELLKAALRSHCFELFVLFSELRRDLIVNRDNGTWLDALDICSNSDEPGTMASFEYYNNSPNHIKNLLFRQLNGTSAWLYGLEGISSSN